MEASPVAATAAALFEQGRFADVVALAEPRVAAGAVEADLLLLLARAYARLGRPADALPIFGALCRAYPTSAQMHLEAALLAHSAGNHSQAEAWLQTAVAAAPALPETHYYLGIVQAAMGDPIHHEAAFRAFGAAVELRPQWLEAWYARAQLGYNNAHIEESLHCVERCISIDANYPDAWYLRYGILADLGRTEDALTSLRRFVEMRPDNVPASRELKRIESMLGSSRRSVARFPKNVALFDDPKRILEEYVLPELTGVAPFLSPSTVVLTTGSCFARNITLSLEKLGISARHVEQLEDISNTYANRYFFEWLAGVSNGYEALFEESFPLNERRNLEHLVRTANVIIFSLGVAPCFFDRASGGFILTLGVNHHIALQSETVEFRTTSVEENVENLLRIDEILAELNPNAVFVLTLSPVPLKATFDHGSAIVADCLSKSTLRVAGEEYLRRAKLRTLYWPSFEMVRWYGGYAPYSVFGAEDGNPRHVNAGLVDDILTCFIDRFATPSLRERLGANVATPD